MNTLLILDDDPWIIAILSLQLESDGCRILTAENPNEALDILERHAIDVVLADYIMPEMLGTEFMCIVKQRHPHTTRMMMSGQPDLVLFSQALNDGSIDKFFIKPLDEKKLREHIQIAFNQHNILEKYQNTRSLLDHLSEGIALIDCEGEIESHNPAFASTIGMEGKLLQGKNIAKLAMLDDQHCLPPLGTWSAEGIRYTSEKQNKTLYFTHQQVYSTQQERQKYILTVYYVAPDLKNISELGHEEYYDWVTGLANRLLLNNLYTIIRAQAERNEWMMALAFIRISNLFEIRDKYDETICNRLLVIISKRLNECLREMDVICRYDGISFVSIFSRIKSKQDIHIIANKILSKLGNEFKIDAHRISLILRIGISAYPGDGGSLDALIKKSKDAMKSLAGSDSCYACSDASSDVAKDQLATNQNIDISNDDSKLLNFHGILSANPLMASLFRKIKKIARHEGTVFIHGATGTGKELFAHAIHNESSRIDKPFIAVNCANFNTQLLESQLFGHRRGAFTGAVKDQPGLLLAAEGGTLFLDEVTDIPAELQAKFLRVLQEKEFTPLGETEAQTFDVRIISASSTHLSEAVSNGNFRLDLQYRLEVIPVTLPLLRERGDDIISLFSHFLKQSITHADDKILINITPLLKQFIEQYNWPGNIRELQNTCAYIATMDASMPLDLSSLPERMQFFEGNDLAFNNTFYALTPTSKPNVIDQAIIKKTLADYDGNKSAAARALGISRMTLWRKMKDLGMN